MFRLVSLIRSTRSLLSSNPFVGIPKVRLFHGVKNGESPVYNHAILFKKPLSIPFFSKSENSVKLMGFVDQPVKVLNTKPDKLGVSTMLRVEDPRNPDRSFSVRVTMWNEMARICVAHLKPNDYIFVSGRLDFSSTRQNIVVTDVKYAVAPSSRVVESHISEKEESNKKKIELWKDLFANPYDWRDSRKNKKSPKFPDFVHKKTREALWLGSDQPVWVNEQLELYDERKEEDGVKDDDMYLWQLFFSNPNDWWDNRVNKKNPKGPDFKHKHTDEALWLRSDLPIWVTRQLELFDQRKAEMSSCYNEEETRRSHFSEWL